MAGSVTEHMTLDLKSCGFKPHVGCRDYLEIKSSKKKQWREKYIKTQHTAATFQNLNWYLSLRCGKLYNKIPNKNIPFKDSKNIYVYPWFPQLVNEIGTVYSTGAHANLQPSALLSSVRYHKIACSHIESGPTQLRFVPVL